MKCKIYRIHECAQAQGLCVIIDVLRAFTTAAFAFAAGAKEIVFVSTLEEAYDKHRADNSIKLMGETFGKIIPGFHYGNSPAEFENISLKGPKMVQRTSAGTQGVVGCKHADQLIVASFVVAEATINRIKTLSPKEVSFIVTGTQDGDEDLALAEYFINRLEGKETDPYPFLERVRNSPCGLFFSDPSQTDFAVRDLELAMQVDRFSFVMEISKTDGDLIAKAV